MKKTERKKEGKQAERKKERKKKLKKKERNLTEGIKRDARKEQEQTGEGKLITKITREMNCKKQLGMLFLKSFVVKRNKHAFVVCRSVLFQFVRLCVCLFVCFVGAVYEVVGREFLGFSCNRILPLIL